ncbi:hypothetical protein TNCV_3075651 [Trichonephila clavipes]|nr:hypothetical protein TNCV_3075651 [Trichonephila clavipes]
MEKTLIKDETYEFETLPANLPHPERDFKKCHEFNKTEQPFKEEIFCVDAAYNSDVTRLSEHKMSKKEFNASQMPVSFEGIINSL